MSDLCIDEFNSRIARIQKARAKGYGFEAAGTLGLSSYTRYRRRKAARASALRPVVVVLFCGTLLKALFLANLGAQAYDDRVSRLMQGEGFDVVGGWLMQSDPITEVFAGAIGTMTEAKG